MSSSDHLWNGFGINKGPPSGFKHTVACFALQSEFQNFNRQQHAREHAIEMSGKIIKELSGDKGNVRLT
jgi:hypothetical protein